MGWDDLLTPKDAPEGYAPTQEELEALLKLNYSTSDFLEDHMSYYLDSFQYYTSGVPFLGTSNPSKACMDRKSFSGPDIFQFFPIKKAILHNETEEISFENDCFKKNTAKMKYNKDKSSLTISIYSNDADSLLCKDSYIVSTSSRYHIKFAFFKGKHTIIFHDLSEDELIEIAVNGIRIFSFCETLTESTISIYKTIKFMLESQKHHYEENAKIFPYYSKKPQPQVELEHMQFLHKFSGFDIEDRGEQGENILPIEDAIQSGDFIGLAEIDNLVSTMIMYLSGGHISHAAIALRIDGQLYASEMKAAGLFLTPWEKFVKEQQFTKHFIIHLPLTEENRKKFNTTAAYEYYKSLKDIGMKYGDYNLLFPWIDVPGQNTAFYIDQEVLQLFAPLVEKISREVIHKNFGKGLNMRLGTEDLKIHDLVIEAAKRGMTFEELAAVPEDDNWKYDNGENIICSSYVAHMYEKAGLFDKYNIDFNAKELQPRDVYMLEFFNRPSWKDERPEICKEVDPDLPYCQIYGRYRLKLHGFGTVKPFDHMFERCPTVPPHYPYSPGC